MKIDLTICPTVRPLIDLLCEGGYPLSTDFAVSADPTVSFASFETMSTNSLLGAKGGFEGLFVQSLYRFLTNYQIGDKQIELVTTVDESSVTVVAEAGGNPMFEMSFGYNGIIRIFGPNYTAVLDANKQLIPIFLSWTGNDGEVVSSVRYTCTSKGRVGHFVHNALEVDQVIRLKDGLSPEAFEQLKAPGAGVAASMETWVTDGEFQLWNPWAETKVTRTVQEDGTLLFSARSKITKEGERSEVWSHTKIDKDEMIAYGWKSRLVKEGETFYLELNKVEEA